MPREQSPFQPAGAEEVKKRRAEYKGEIRYHVFDWADDYNTTDKWFEDFEAAEEYAKKLVRSDYTKVRIEELEDDEDTGDIIWFAGDDEDTDNDYSRAQADADIAVGAKGVGEKIFHTKDGKRIMEGVDMARLTEAEKLKFKERIARRIAEKKAQRIKEEAVNTNQKPKTEGELDMKDKDPKKEGNVKTNVAASDAPVHQSGCPCATDKNDKKAGDPNLGKEDIAKAGSSTAPVVAGGQQKSDPNLSKDCIFKAPVNTAPVKQGDSSITKDKEGLDKSDPSLGKEGIAKAGNNAAPVVAKGGQKKDPNLDGENMAKEGKVPDVTKDNVDGIIKELLEKHGLGEGKLPDVTSDNIAGIIKALTEKCKAVNEADLKMDAVQANVAAGLISWAIKQPRVQQDSSKPDGMVDWIQAGNEILNSGLADAAANAKSFTLSGPLMGPAIGLINWAIKQPDIQAQSKLGVVNVSTIGNEIINPPEKQTAEVAKQVPTAPEAEPAPGVIPEPQIEDVPVDVAADAEVGAEAGAELGAGEEASAEGAEEDLEAAVPSESVKYMTAHNLTERKMGDVESLHTRAQKVEPVMTENVKLDEDASKLDEADMAEAERVIRRTFGR